MVSFRKVKKAIKKQLGTSGKKSNTVIARPKRSKHYVAPRRSKSAYTMRTRKKR